MAQNSIPPQNTRNDKRNPNACSGRLQLQTAQIVRLLKGPPPYVAGYGYEFNRFSPEHLAELFAAHQGNIRAALRELYNQYQIAPESCNTTEKWM